MRTQKSRINFHKEKFADYKGRENVFWAAWVRIRTKVVQS